MWLVWNTAFFALLVTCAQATCSTAALASRSCVIATALKPLLSKHAKISFNASTDVRWSEYHAPNPDAIVNIATELDVVATVKYCLKNKIPFLAQNGGSGWISTFDLGSNGVLINLHGLNEVTFNPARTQAVVGGGAIISETIAAAYANNAQITTGNCNCVGTLGAILGGGYGNLMGLNGFGVDTVISINYVNTAGNLLTIGPNSSDLWWALRGAGPNFGIVTSAVVKSTPVAQKDSKAWLGGIIFTEDKLESVVSAINDLKLEPQMNIFMYFVVSNSAPAILVTPFYYGDEITARQKFATIFTIGPVADTTAVTSYDHWNDGAAGFCNRGDRKPSYGAGMLQMIPSTWRAVWNEFVKFTSNPGTDHSVVLVEAYSLDKAGSVPDGSSAFPYRHVRFNAVAIPWYSDASLDPVAEAYGNKARNLWRESDDLENNSTYINFANGDEDLEIIYGQNLMRLQALKRKYDPENVFNQWFPLTPRS